MFVNSFYEIYCDGEGRLCCDALSPLPVALVEERVVDSERLLRRLLFALLDELGGILRLPAWLTCYRSYSTSIG